jgi:serine/threonine protein kinase
LGDAGADAAAAAATTQAPRPGVPTAWNEISMWVPQEVLEARPDAVLAGRYVRVGPRALGSGSYGEVWKAYDKRLERWVALKIVQVPDDHARRAALLEAKTLGGLRHPHIAQVLDAGDLDDHACYLAMEFIDGDTLESRIGGPVVASVRLVHDAALAVHHAHLHRFIHRDLKPRNLMCERDRPEHVFVLDFGVARWMPSPRGDSARGPVGTFAYMAPEQASGGEVDARADIYGLGTTLYHLLAGRIYPPLAIGDTWMTMARKVIEDVAAPARTFNPDVDDELDAILAQALAKRPSARHDSAQAFADALAMWIEARSRPAAQHRHAASDLVADRYRLVRQIGKGGFGDVFVAEDTHTSGQVVVKRQRDRSPEVRARMLRSAQVQSRASHPFIVPVFDVGDDATGLPFMVMPFVRDARTLDAVDLPVHDKVRLLRDSAVAIHVIHELGYYRLDQKPGNALVTGRPPLIQLIDFDLALHIDDARDDGAIAGTPAVMSPEQVGSGKPLDRRTDVFSLGATLYFALAGRYPLHSLDGDFGDLIANLLENRLVDLRTVAPAIDAGLRKLVMRCLAYDPADRFPTSAGLADALTGWLAARGAS